ncbi:hypothetical protein V866_005399 [Kwoniella sp. B9012]
MQDNRHSQSSTPHEDLGLGPSSFKRKLDDIEREEDEGWRELLGSDFYDSESDEPMLNEKGSSSGDVATGLPRVNLPTAQFTSFNPHQNPNLAHDASVSFPSPFPQSDVSYQIGNSIQDTQMSSSADFSEVVMEDIVPQVLPDRVDMDNMESERQISGLEIDGGDMKRMVHIDLFTCRPLRGWITQNQIDPISGDTLTRTFGYSSFSVVVNNIPLDQKNDLDLDSWLGAVFRSFRRCDEILGIYYFASSSTDRTFVGIDFKSEAGASRALHLAEKYRWIEYHGKKVLVSVVPRSYEKNKTWFIESSQNLPTLQKRFLERPRTRQLAEWNQLHHTDVKLPQASPISCQDFGELPTKQWPITFNQFRNRMKRAKAKSKKRRLTAATATAASLSAFLPGASGSLPAFNPSAIPSFIDPLVQPSPTSLLASSSSSSRRPEDTLIYRQATAERLPRLPVLFTAGGRPYRGSYWEWIPPSGGQPEPGQLAYAKRQARQEFSTSSGDKYYKGIEKLYGLRFPDQLNDFCLENRDIRDAQEASERLSGIDRITGYLSQQLFDDLNLPTAFSVHGDHNIPRIDNTLNVGHAVARDLRDYVQDHPGEMYRRQAAIGADPYISQKRKAALLSRGKGKGKGKGKAALVDELMSKINSTEDNWDIWTNITLSKSLPTESLPRPDPEITSPPSSPRTDKK